MNKGICKVSVAPLRAEASHQSEMTSQLLYGETLDILQTGRRFLKIKMHFDGYEGWVDAQQIATLSDTDFAARKCTVATQPVGIYELADGQTLLSIGSDINSKTDITLEGPTCETVSNTAKLFLNVPYLWSGRSFFGIDCSGFVQMVFKLHGVSLPRDSRQQAEMGEVLSFIEESKPGDLAFFDNDEGVITHVGIMLQDQKIIHAYGKVRIDSLDSSGIFNEELKKHTHKLRFLRSIFG
ncbi:C40 family peptidase [Kaistella palustris]|uniref:C40 family peptidase n=1 Tax=Kaistella palustris TaxID=493376 RepID=UPI0004202B1B|nr:C40 family peptidase [Kaistella palustris]